MGGGKTTISHVDEEEDGESVESLLFDLYSQTSDDSTSNTNTNNTQSVNGEVDEKVDEFKKLVSSDSSQADILSVRRVMDFEEIMASYDSLKDRVHDLEQAKSKILSYKPGAWIEEVGCLTTKDYDIQKTTTLLLVGLEGSGKSSLVNRISRVFEDDKFASERAQVSYNCAGDGTLFLHEYMIPRGSTSFCVYDTRGLYENLYDNVEMIKTWMTKGVRHGELIFRDTDSLNEDDFMKCKSRQSVCSTERRMVNFVIFVIDALSVLKSMDGEDDAYDDLLEGCFNCPYLSCRDDKPVVVCTHGDLLSHADRARVRVHLGELLGIPPAKQIFDIPENSNQETDLVVVGMLTYSLLHADKNLPVKSSPPYKVLGVLLIVLVLLCVFAYWITHLTSKPEARHATWGWSCNLKEKIESVLNVHATPSSKPWQRIHRNWNEIRHLW